jgi:hypothetical protein
MIVVRREGDRTDPFSMPLEQNSTARVLPRFANVGVSVVKATSDM